MKKLLLLTPALSLLCSASLCAQSLSAGIRLGDLNGISVKKYMGNTALELSFGRTAVFRSDYTYLKAFHKQFDSKYPVVYYVGYDYSFPLGVQLQMLYHRNIDKIGDLNTEGLKWYWGYGALMRFQTITYRFTYWNPGMTGYQAPQDNQVVNLDFGGDVLIGAEYRLKNVPISFFADLGLFMEVFDEPFTFTGIGGIGGRYHFSGTK